MASKKLVETVSCVQDYNTAADTATMAGEFNQSFGNIELGQGKGQAHDTDFTVA